MPETLRTLIERTAQAYPTRPALATIEGENYSYDIILRRSRQLSAYLTSVGVQPGDRVAILGENSPQWGMTYFGITQMGAVAVPVLPDFPAADVGRIIRHAEVRAVFVSSRLYEKVLDLAPQETGPVVLLDDFTRVAPGTPAASVSFSPDGRPTVLLDDAASKSPVSAPAADDLAVIMYTSGTTGHSKGVMLTHRNIVADAFALLKIVPVEMEDRMLSVLPLSHTYECTLGLVTPLMVGASVYYMQKPPTAAVLLPALEKVRPTIMLSVPLIIEKIYKAKIYQELTKTALLRMVHATTLGRKALHRIAGRRLLRTFGGRLRIFAIGGAPLAADVELFLREARFPYAIGYGLTETAPLIAGTHPSHTRYRSTGPALPGTQIRIADPRTATGEGEIQVKGPTVMRGYYKDPERTREAFTEDGWLKTGDLGVIQPDGYIFIKGRSKNMILGPSGKNIYPEELESIINEFDTVRESVVYEHQNRLVALVHPDYEKLQKVLHSLSETDIRKMINDKLNDLQRQINERVPLYSRIHKIIEQAEPFQKTPTQKIKRYLYIPR
jgi:long-chain acyl-CoA synthetase